jgi:hypothetical protein
MTKGKWLNIELMIRHSPIRPIRKFAGLMLCTYDVLIFRCRSSGLPLAEAIDWLIRE